VTVETPYVAKHARLVLLLDAMEVGESVVLDKSYYNTATHLSGRYLVDRPYAITRRLTEPAVLLRPGTTHGAAKFRLWKVAK
jgi:hypothetical protein